MTKLSTLKVVAAAAGICASMFAAGTASAYTYATSHLKVEDLRINAYTANIPFGAAVVQGYSFSQNNSATLVNQNQTTTASCGTNDINACPNSIPVLNAAAANAPGSTVLRADNNFAQLGFGNPNSSYSNADSVLYTAELPMAQPNQIPPATSLEMIAESLLNVNGSAQANAIQNSTTSLTTVFDILQGGTGLTLNFAALGSLMSAVNGPQGSYLAQSSMNVDFRLQRQGGGTVTWSPNGDVTGNGCKVTGLAGVTCTEINDDADLNAETGASFNPDSDAYSFVRSLFGIDIQGLDDGNYTLVLNAKVTTDVSRKVPEPDALALLGIALAGLAFVSKRKASKQA